MEQTDKIDCFVVPSEDGLMLNFGNISIEFVFDQKEVTPLGKGEGESGIMIWKRNMSVKSDEELAVSEGRLVWSEEMPRYDIREIIETIIKSNNLDKEE